MGANVRYAHSRINQATLEKEVWDWEDTRSGKSTRTSPSGPSRSSRMSRVKVAIGSTGVPGLTNGVLALLIHRLPLIMFDDFLGGIFLPRLLLRGGRIAGSRASGHGEEEHGDNYRRHDGHGTSLILSVFGVAK